MSDLTNPLKWHGRKQYLAKRIVAMMPPHLHYVEPYAGGAAVLLVRDPNDERLWLPPHKGVSEVLNDINGELMNFWRTLQCEHAFGKFLREVQAIPLSRSQFDYESQRPKLKLDEPDWRLALSFFVRARQSRAGTFKGFTSLTRNRLRRGGRTVVRGHAPEFRAAL